MFPGETVCSGAPVKCVDCGKGFRHFEILRSDAGWYIGLSCECGPYTRESGYYKTEWEAQHALDVDSCNMSNVMRVRDDHQLLPAWARR